MKKLQNVRGVADVLAMKKIALILALAFPLTAGIALATSFASGLLPLLSTDPEAVP